MAAGKTNILRFKACQILVEAAQDPLTPALSPRGEGACCGLSSR